MAGHRLGVRWTMGDVSAQGWEALRLSLWGAFRIFGDAAAYAVCVNTVPLPEARQRLGELPPGTSLHAVTAEQLPAFLRRRLGEGMTDGTAWKLAPLRVFGGVPELSLDNDCILWALPEGMRAWLEGDPLAALVAEDVRAANGCFSGRLGDVARNMGIRGVHPGFDLEAALRQVLAEVDHPLTSELDEQGLQLSALSLHRTPHVVRLQEVSICSPFWPHLPHLGTCGAHFVGLNAHRLPWDYEGRPATELTREHFARHRPVLRERVGLSPAFDTSPAGPGPMPGGPGSTHGVHV